jgi:hypothetical protein
MNRAHSFKQLLVLIILYFWHHMWNTLVNFLAIKSPKGTSVKHLHQCIPRIDPKTHFGLLCQRFLFAIFHDFHLLDQIFQVISINILLLLYCLRFSCYLLFSRILLFRKFRLIHLLRAVLLYFLLDLFVDYNRGVLSNTSDAPMGVIFIILNADSLRPSPTDVIFIFIVIVILKR